MKDNKNINESNCENKGHDWYYKYSYNDVIGGTYCYTYKRFDTFYCKNCLDTEDKLVRREDTRGNPPEWFKNIYGGEIVER